MMMSRRCSNSRAREAAWYNRGMNENENENEKILSDDEVKEELLEALGQKHPEDELPKDPFALDAQGHVPAEEDSMGGSLD